MNGIENAQHDLSDASFCLDTAIELLTSIGNDESAETELSAVLRRLQELKSGLDESTQLLAAVQTKLYGEH